jgi:D-alanine-D-alanine ligase
VTIRNSNIRIGFTYDLKDDYLKLGFSPEEAAEFDTRETIEGISATLEELGFEVDNIGNVKSLITRLLKGESWDIVFNICEGVFGIGREAQVPAILDVYNIPYVFSDVLVLSLTLHKGLTKNIIRDNGIPTAAFIVADHSDDLLSHNLEFPLFVKPVAEGTGKGIAEDSKVYNQTQLLEVASDRIRRFGQSVLVESFLPGREFTVGIAGTGNEARVVGMMEVIYKPGETSGIYSYQNKAHYEDYIEYTVPEQSVYNACSNVALKAWKALGCRDGGRIDLRMDAYGVPNFIEVNPLAGLNPVHSDLPILAYKAGITYKQLIKMIMDSALARLKGVN